MAKKVKKSAPKKAAKKIVKKSTKKTVNKKIVKKAAPKKAAKKSASKPKLSAEQLNAKVLGKVETYIRKLYGKNYEKHDDGRFLVFEGSTVVQTMIRPWHEGDVVVESIAYVVQDAHLNEKLLHYLLRENAMLHFGAFGLGFDNTITFSHSLAGANMDENEFAASIKSVAKIADHYDNKIVEMAGGMTSREAMKKGVGIL